MFESIGDPMLLSTRTANSLLTKNGRGKGFIGTFSAEMIIATVGLNEIGEDEMKRAGGGSGSGSGSGGASKKRRRH